MEHDSTVNVIDTAPHTCQAVETKINKINGRAPGAPGALSVGGKLVLTSGKLEYLYDIAGPKPFKVAL